MVNLNEQLKNMTNKKFYGIMKGINCIILVHYIILTISKNFSYSIMAVGKVCPHLLVVHMHEKTQLKVV